MTKNERWIISVLALINFFNYVDRQIVFPLFHNIQLEFGLTDFQLGLIGTVFVLVFSLTTIPLGVLADKISRKAVMLTGVLFWSATTLLSGTARGFKSLLAFRGLVGVGEASYAPAATAMIADNFHHEKRARVQGLWHIGMFIGGTIGAMLGGVIVFYTGSWRLAFFIVSIPGFILALTIFKLKDKRESQPYKQFSFKPLFKSPAFVLVLVAGVFSAFTTNAYVSWGVEYIRRFTDLNLLNSSIALGVATMTAGTVGILIGSSIADKWQKKTPAGRSLLVALSLILAAPFIFIGFEAAANVWLSMSLITIGVTFMSFYFGPVAAVIQDIVPGNLRATAFATYIFVIHLIGGSMAPAVVGKLSDVFDLRRAMEISTVGVLISGLIFFLVARIIHKNGLPGHSNLEEEELAPMPA